MAACEYCRTDKRDVRPREYSIPQVIDAAAAVPTPTGASKTRTISTCDECDHQMRQGGSEALIWLEKRLGNPL